MNNEKIKELEKKYKQVYEISNGNFYVSTKTSDEICDENWASDDTGIIFGDPGCWGMLDKDGNVIIEPKYLFPLFPEGNSYQVAMLDEIRIIDGKRIITHILQGLINEKGEEIITIEYPFMRCLDSNGNYFEVFDQHLNKDGVLDKKNNIIIPFDYDYIDAPSYELCVPTRKCCIYPKVTIQLSIKKNGLYGVYDIEKKEEIIKPKYKSLKVIGYNRFLVDDGIIINDSEEKLKTYEEVYQENIIKLEELKNNCSSIKCDNDFFMWKSENYKDPDGYVIRYDNLYNIPCTCDGLISLRRMSYFASRTNYVENILDEYKTLRKYPIIYFPSEEGGINQSRADYKKFSDFIDYTLYDIKRFYELLNNINKDEITVKEVLDYNETLKQKIVLIEAYTLEKTFTFLTSFSSFKDFIDWEFKNNDSLIGLFVNKNYDVYDIETGNVIKDYKKHYTWNDDYYNNLKKQILKYNEIEDRQNGIIMNFGNKKIKHYEELYSGTNFEDKVKQYYMKVINENPYIDPDEIDYVDKIPFYADLTEFLNIREDEFVENGKIDNKYIYLPPKKSKLLCELESGITKQDYPVTKKIYEEYKKIKKNLDNLDDKKITVYDKKHKCYFYLTSDQFGFSFNGTAACNSKYPYGKYFHMLMSKNLSKEKLEKELMFIAKSVNDTRTIGGSFLFPTKVLPKRSCAYNKARGADSYIEDRVDLTLLEIKHTYEKDYEKNYTRDILYNQYYNEETYMKKWLKHFKTFKNYADFFCFDGNFVNGDKIIDITENKYLPELYKKVLENLTVDVLRKTLDNVSSLTLKRSKEIEEIINSKER